MKTYIVTSYIPNSEIDVDLYNALVRMSKERDAELVIADCRFNYKNDLGELLNIAIEEELGDHIVKGSYRFNSNLSLSDYRQSINVIDPISGMAMDSAAASIGSLIVAFPRHRFKSVARSLKHSKSPSGIWCTGTISEPYYKNTKSGSAMKNYHQKGALLVEVLNDSKFNVRQLQWDGEGFYDLDRYYTANKIKKDSGAILGLSMGDLHPPFVNLEVLEETREFIRKYKPEHVLLHDSFDAVSISHHVVGKHITKSLISNSINSLNSELIITSSVIASLAACNKKTKFHIVKSNHDEHLDRYLDEFRFKEDYPNLELALELAGKYILHKKGLSEVSVLEYALKKYNRLKNVYFHDRNDKLSLAGYEVLNHGDYGANGSRGNAKRNGVAFDGKLVTGHTHSPEITAFGNPVNGTSTYLSLSYTNDSGTSSWLNTHTIIYKNGTISHYHIILD